MAWWFSLNCMGDDTHQVQLLPRPNDPSLKSDDNHEAETGPVAARYKTKRCICIIVMVIGVQSYVVQKIDVLE